MAKFWYIAANPPGFLVADGGAVEIVVTAGDERRRPDLGYDESGAAASPEDRRLLAAALGLEAGRLVFMEQVHAGRVVLVSGGSQGMAGAGLQRRETAVGVADGLVTTADDIALVGLSADCPLVALWDDGAGVCAVVHAGWRSLNAKILGAAVAVMRQQGAAPERLRAVMGPAIGRCCYEVQGDLVDTLTASGAARAEDFSERQGRTYLDLAGVVGYQLASAGLRPQNVAAELGCTRCRREFHSYRRDGRRAGRQAMAIRRKG
jgi:hypothetical protein